MPSNHLILCRPLLLLPSVFPSIRIFSNGSAFCVVGQNIGASASILAMNFQGWFPLGLIDLISLLSKGLSHLQHHNSKASVLWCPAFSMVQLSYPYMTAGETIALTIQTFVGKSFSLKYQNTWIKSSAYSVGAYRILVLWLGIKPVPLALEGEVLTTGTPGNSICYWLFNYKLLWLFFKKCGHF